MSLYTYRAQVTRVVDGDTIVVDIDLGLSIWLRGQHLRLAGVNTPEIHGVKKESAEYAAGQAAKNFVISWMEQHGPDVIIETSKDRTGKFGRWLCQVYNDLTEEFCLNQQLLDTDHAEPY
ncbi:MAG: nuclease [Anaerolineae bacterium]|nr:nuclease [Anaerolineae bacterium]NIN99200.1 nuclease [Anaerolineae bacterium]NIQ82041.1 nuclease [Anaerolineae bacterium]